jgi:hypothetical protein
VTARKITIDDRAKFFAWFRRFNGSEKTAAGLLEGIAARFRDQRVFGFEVPVKAAVGHAGGLHQFSNANRRDAALAEQPRCDSDDLFPVLGCNFPRISQRFGLWYASRE